MDTIFIEYRDPLFGVILFFVLLFLISFLSYWWGRYKNVRDNKGLESFLEKFDTTEEFRIGNQIEQNSVNNETWLLLAQGMEHQGHNEKSIEIYHALLRTRTDPALQKELLLKLGKAYFKSGFLERSKNAFLQVLQSYPRTPQALHHLVLIYEQLHQFDLALEVMESLEELESDNQKEKLYLQSRLFLNNPHHTIDDKATFLVDLYENHSILGYMVFEYLFTHRPAMAWQHFDHALSHKIADILWRTEEEHLDLDIIARNAFLRELYSAKGSLALASSSSLFELDTILALKQCNKRRVSLQFEYTCTACHQISFFPFHRCSQCHAIDTIDTIMNLAKEHYEEYHSLQ